MKRTHKHLPLFIVLCSLFTALASCDKYEGPDPVDKTPTSLTSTSWIFSIKDSVSTTDDQGGNILADYTINYYLIFKTNSVGLIKTEAVSHIQPALNQEVSYDCTYDYTMPNGALHYWESGAHGNIIKTDCPFAVDGTKLTIDLGSGPLVYERMI